MNTGLDIVGALILVAGTAFLLLGGLGLNRMPDIFNRIHAGTKATTLGTVLTLTGIACLRPEWAVKLGLIALFLLFTNPLSSQILGRTAHETGEGKDADLTVDRLEDDVASGEGAEERS